MFTPNIEKATIFEKNGEIIRKKYIEGVCLSTDTKPTENIGNGSKIAEMDTSTLYLYDEENEIWRVWGC